MSLVEKAISNSKLDLNPFTEGQFIRINLPELTSERRQEFAKNIRSLAEEAKIAIRNIRQDEMNNLKKSTNEGSISQDEIKDQQDVIQKVTDEHTNIINDICKNKETEIMQI